MTPEGKWYYCDVVGVCLMTLHAYPHHFDPGTRGGSQPETLTAGGPSSNLSPLFCQQKKERNENKRLSGELSMTKSVYHPIPDASLCTQCRISQLCWDLPYQAVALSMPSMWGDQHRPCKRLSESTSTKRYQVQCPCEGVAMPMSS